MSDASLYGEGADTRPSQDGFGISPIQLLQTLRRSWVFIALCGVVFGGASYAYTVASVPKKFTTNATISVQQPQVAIPALRGALNGDTMSDPMPLVRSEVQILTSRALIQKVADELHLRDSPEFNGSLRPPTATEAFKRDLSASLPRVIAEPLISVGLLPDTTLVDGPIPENVIQDSVVGAVQHDLSIINDNRSLIIVAQFTALEPDVAARVVNTLVRQYINDRVQGRATANGSANVELVQRVKDARAEIDGLEARIAGVREKYNLVQTRAGSVGQQQLEDLSAALTRASSDRAQAVANYQRAAALARSGAVSSDNATVIGSSTIGTLREREAAAARRVALLSTTLGSGHPDLRAAQAELGSIRSALASEAQRVVASLGAQADVATAREADVKRQLEDAQKTVGSLSAVQSELTQLEKDADSRRAIYQTLLQGEAQTASNKVGSEDTGVRIVSLAVPPAYPSSPRPKMAAILGIMSGCAFGGLIALTRGRRDTGFGGADEVIQATGITPLVVLPRRAGRQALVDLVAANPTGPEAEALRSLRTRLRFAGRNAAPRSILFLSSVAAEGSADVAAAFARVAAIDGLHVLLLEGDLQAPSLARRLKVPASNGLVDSLQGGETWQDQVEQDPASNLGYLLASAPPRGAAQLLDSMQLRNLLAEARDDYNLVVMTGQPIGTGSDAMIVATIVETVVLVVGGRKAKREQVRQAVQTLATAIKKRPVMALSDAA